MQLSERLNTILSLVSQSKCVADVGCDHGFVSIELINRKIAENVIAMDIRQGPLMRAQEHIMQTRLSDKIQTRLSDGVAALKPGEADSLIIAGMGGNLVIHILENGKETVKDMKQCILQPQSEIQKVRKYLRENDFKIIEEKMVFEDGKYYPMMKVRPPVADTAGEDTEVKCWDTVQLKYGKLLLEKQHPVLREYLEREIRIYQSILEGLKAKDSDRIRQRKEELEQELVEAEKGMEYYAV